jgi:hypothetical protein
MARRRKTMQESLPGMDAGDVAGNGRRSSDPTQGRTSKQQLYTTIKSVRDLLRKDAGLSGDTDRLPQLTWLLFLKAFDDFEFAREEELGAAYEPVIEPSYRWRDWVAVADKTQRLTGDELLDLCQQSSAASSQQDFWLWQSRYPQHRRDHFSGHVQSHSLRLHPARGS